MKQDVRGHAGERQQLKDARAVLAASAARALSAGTLSDEDTVRVRLALKRGRSFRTSNAGLAFAARACLSLAHELDREAAGPPRREVG